jgi:hypothetical protein
MSGLVSVDGTYQEATWHISSSLSSVVEMIYRDRDRHYLISTCSNVAGSDPIRRTRLRQLQPIETDEPPERVEITIVKYGVGKGKGNCRQRVHSNVLKKQVK